MKLMYNVADVIAAAKYLAENNTKLNKDSQEIFDCIMSDIMEYKNDPGISFMATCGYLITFCEDDDILAVDVYVRPTFDEGFYDTREL